MKNMQQMQHEFVSIYKLYNKVKSKDIFYSDRKGCMKYLKYSFLQKNLNEDIRNYAKLLSKRLFTRIYMI